MEIKRIDTYKCESGHEFDSYVDEHSPQHQRNECPALVDPAVTDAAKMVLCRKSLTLLASKPADNNG